jgi:metal-responsive CopG/Arc/MetJ family transcriptional regulator
MILISARYLYGCLEYNYLVRLKTSITLPEELLKSIDQADQNRSAFIERASRAYLARLERAKREARDIEIINAHADRLNEEAMDVLEYQGLP